MAVDGKVVIMDLLDTAGQDEYSGMRDLYIRKGEGFLLVYSITSRTSLAEVRAFRELVLRVKDEVSYPMVLVGNKCDLQSEREVKHDEARDLAHSWGIPFLECSALTGHNVNEAFIELVRSIRKKNGTVKTVK
eukprot:TRINITY_DN8160_c0_g4_i1.p1 TRINITY_DN8160_c0_g4~~TRINITY_DN8160_c0_g4_i1.p1  ORF type:complete len:133 (+),score=8.98 TRINITY_DN8160_c0_g4_i1:270-668(+)